MKGSTFYGAISDDTLCGEDMHLDIMATTLQSVLFEDPHNLSTDNQDDAQ
jgi:hypothetical protein